RSSGPTMSSSTRADRPPSPSRPPRRYDGADDAQGRGRGGAMIDRATAGSIPDKPHTAMRDAEGRLLYEEMHPREGSAGPFTSFYHTFPITAARRVTRSERGWARPRREEDAREPLQRRLYDGSRLPPGTMLCYDRTPLLFSEHATLFIARPTETDE